MPLPIGAPESSDRFDLDLSHLEWPTSSADRALTAFRSRGGLKWLPTRYSIWTSFANIDPPNDIIRCKTIDSSQLHLLVRSTQREFSFFPPQVIISHVGRDRDQIFSAIGVGVNLAASLNHSERQITGRHISYLHDGVLWCASVCTFVLVFFSPLPSIITLHHSPPFCMDYCAAAPDHALA